MELRLARDRPCSGGPGGASVSGGSLHVDGGLAGTDATFGPGHSLEFAATFGAATFQHVAFTDNFTSAWAMFSTRRLDQPALRQHQHRRRCRRHPGRRAWPRLGSQHVYRIQWDAGQVQYYIDGNLVHTASATFGPT